MLSFLQLSPEDGLTGPPANAYGLAAGAWVLPINTLLRASIQFPGGESERGEPPPVTKVSPPLSESVIALLRTRLQSGRSQTAAKLVCAQLNEVVKRSRTVTAHGPSFPLPHAVTVLQSSLSLGHRVAVRLPPCTMG